MTQSEYTGFGSINNLPVLLQGHGVRRVLLVTGKRSFSESSAERIILPLMGSFEVRHYDQITSNPDLASVIRGIESYDACSPDAVEAVGGGSVIDTAKMLHFFGTNGIHPETWLKQKQQMSTRKTCLFVAVPTTAGSGSEATPFAVLYINGVKHSIEHASILPDICIVDPVFSSTAPPYLTAVSGFDALAQAVESLWSTRSTIESMGYARKALERIVPNLVAAVREGSPDARLAMAEGAHLAGKAIAISRTTAPHAVSYPITARFGIPHGHAVGILLPSFLEYNAGVSDTDLQDLRGCKFVTCRLREISALIGATSTASAAAQLRFMASAIGLELRLSQFGIKSAREVDLIVAEGFAPERVKNNPRVLTEDKLREMLQALL